MIVMPALARARALAARIPPKPAAADDHLVPSLAHQDSISGHGVPWWPSSGWSGRRSAVQDAGFLLLELGLGQHARRQQLAELRQLGEPVTHIGWLRRGGRPLRWRDRGRVLRWRRGGHSCRAGLVLRGPPLLLPALDPAVHRTGDRDGGGGLENTHRDLSSVASSLGPSGVPPGSGRLGRVKG